MTNVPKLRGGTYDQYDSPEASDVLRLRYGRPIWKRSPAGGHEDGTYLTFFAATESLVPLACATSSGQGAAEAREGRSW